jgi:pimeloyl-ACP methyl ester carboxylesterase
MQGLMHSAFNQFAAFSQDAIDNKDFVAKGKLAIPILAVGAEKSFVIPNSGHWLMEEQPAATIDAIVGFLK